MPSKFNAVVFYFVMGVMVLLTACVELLSLAASGFIDRGEP